MPCLPRPTTPPVEASNEPRGGDSDGTEVAREGRESENGAASARARQEAELLKEKVARRRREERAGQRQAQRQRAHAERLQRQHLDQQGLRESLEAPTSF